MCDLQGLDDGFQETRKKDLAEHLVNFKGAVTYGTFKTSENLIALADSRKTLQELMAPYIKDSLKCTLLDIFGEL
jgi:hypothetical protein